MPALVALIAALLAWFGGDALRALLPTPLGRTAVPELLLLGATGTLGAALAWARAHTAAWRDAALTLALGTGLTALVVGLDPRAPFSSHVEGWAPWFAVAAAATWGLGWAVERRTARAQRWPTVLLVALALAGAGLATAQDLHRSVRVGDRYRAWNAYHYVLGSKYFPELGYTDLYAATLAADDRARAQHLEPRLDGVRWTRDMRTYQVIARREAVAALDRSDLPDATLDALHHDLRGLLPFLDDDTWGEVLADLGYNPAPAWPVVGRPLATALGTHGTGRWVLLQLDLPLFALMIGMLWWGWGPRVAAAAVLYVTLVGFNRARLIGGFLQYDWLASLITAMALHRRGHGASAGVALSWGAMTRVFPGFLIFPALATLVVGTLRGREVPRRTRRFAIAFTAACAVWFVLSHTTGRGLATWPEWFEGIRLHSTLHPYDGRARMGLLRLGAHMPTLADPWGAAERTVDLATAHALAARVRPFQVVGTLFVLAVAMRRRATDRALWMLALVWVTVITSRYYASGWALLLCLGLPERGDADGRQEPAGVALALMVLLMPWLFYLYPDHEPIYFLTNYGFALGMVAAGALWLAGDLANRKASTNDSRTM